MPIPVFDNLRQWLTNKDLQGFLKVADSDPHPRASEIIQQIDVAKVTNKQVRRVLNLKWEGFDVVQKMNKGILSSYFREYSPSTKTY